jgi:cytochrome c oxidase cbb3-type subunit 2
MFLRQHQILANNPILLAAGILVVAAVGGIVEIAPLFYLKSTIEKVEGTRPYTPLELMGRAIYAREGCAACHTQMVRPLREDVERYGHYSLAAESVNDHPALWGSKRTGPDLARVGGRHPDQWHVAHFADPRALVPQSTMPAYAFLAQSELDYRSVAAHMRTNRALGVPYTDEQIANAAADVRAQATPADPGGARLRTRYPKVIVRDFDGNPRAITEMDALVAYLQMLGTLVDFQRYDEKANLR